MIDFFCLSKSFFDDLLKRQYIFKKGLFECYFCKPKEITLLTKTINADYYFLPNDHFSDSFNISTDEIVETTKLKNSRLCLIGKKGMEYILDQDKCIFTPFVNISKREFPDCTPFLRFNSLEIYPLLNNNNLIIDIVETGNTMMIHELEIKKEIMDIELFLLRRAK